MKANEENKSYLKQKGAVSMLRKNYRKIHNFFSNNRKNLENYKTVNTKLNLLIA